MCQLSSTATICESCLRLISYTPNKSFCALVTNTVTSSLSMNPIDEIEDRACLEDPKDISRHVSSQFCKRCERKRCEPDGKQGDVEV